jgi:hypothetical protein
MFSILLVMAASASAHAVGSNGQSFVKNSSIYTEIAVPCLGSTPDLQSPVAVNQAQPGFSGGECRVVTTMGESFRVENSQLIFVNSKGVSSAVGTLRGTPSCYQTDAGGEFYATWVPVQLN